MSELPYQSIIISIIIIIVTTIIIIIIIIIIIMLIAPTAGLLVTRFIVLSTQWMKEMRARGWSSLV